MANVEYVQSMSGKLEDVKVGTTLYFTKTVSECDVYMFSGITGDFRRITSMPNICGKADTASALPTAR